MHKVFFVQQSWNVGNLSGCRWSQTPIHSNRLTECNGDQGPDDEGIEKVDTANAAVVRAARVDGTARLFAERTDNLCRNVEEEYRADERQRENQDHKRINSQSRRIVRVELEHGIGRSACASSACRVWLLDGRACGSASNLSTRRTCYCRR